MMDTQLHWELAMAMSRGIFTVWIIYAVGFAAQSQADRVLEDMLNSGVIHDAPTEPQNLDVSKLFIKLIFNDTETTYRLCDAVDPIVAYCLNHPTVLWTHGFYSSCNDASAREASDNLKLYISGGCIIVLDHHEYTYSTMDVVCSYNRAVKHYYDIAIALCEFLVKLFERKCITNLIQVIGHSLGAHIIAVAEQCLKNRTGVILPFTKACDPAGPAFKTFSLTSKYSQSFICNGGHFGIIVSKTTAVLHFNGGEYQKGCGAKSKPTLVSSGCSHFACLKACTLPAAVPGIWTATPCDPEQNCKTGVSEGNGTVLADFHNTYLTGDYYIETGDRFIGEHIDIKSLMKSLSAGKNTQKGRTKLF